MPVEEKGVSVVHNPQVEPYMCICGFSNGLRLNGTVFTLMFMFLKLKTVIMKTVIERNNSVESLEKTKSFISIMMMIFFITMGVASLYLLINSPA